MNTIADEMTALGWTKAARVARIRFSSRSRVDSAAEGGPGEKWQGVKNLPSMW